MTLTEVDLFKQEDNRLEHLLGVDKTGCGCEIKQMQLYLFTAVIFGEYGVTNKTMKLLRYNEIRDSSIRRSFFVDKLSS